MTRKRGRPSIHSALRSTKDGTQYLRLIAHPSHTTPSVSSEQSLALAVLVKFQ